MRPGIRRFTYGAFAAIGLFAATAQAQTPVTTSKLTIDVAPVTQASPLRATSIFAPKVQTSFQSGAQSQMGPAAEDNGIGFGVLGMITRSSISGDEFLDIKSRTGGGIGVWIGGNRNGRVGFTGEFIYLTRNSEVLGDEFKTKALEIPAVFHVNLGSRSRNSIGGYIVVGPVFSINLKHFINDVEIDDEFNGADIGIIGGAGIEVFRIGIEARGNWGLRNISSEGTTTDSKTFTFELLGKFAFN